MNKLTPWFPDNVKPAYVGVYENRVKFGHNGLYLDGYSYWDGEYWMMMNFTKDKTISDFEISGNQYRQLRGLAEKPE